MAHTLPNKYSLFSPKTIQDLMISPYTSCIIYGVRGTMLCFEENMWRVSRNDIVSKSEFYTPNEAEAVDEFWRLESRP